LTPLCNQLCRISSGMIRNTIFMRKSDSAAHGMLIQAQRYHWHRCNMYIGIIFTAVACTLHSCINYIDVTCTAVPITPLCKYDTALPGDLILDRLRLSLKGIFIEKTYMGKLSCTISITFTQKIWGLTKDRFWSTVSMMPLWQKSEILL
jgi:hypothetical protein